MPLHLIKLCVGCDSVQDLKDWIKEQLAKKKKSGEAGNASIGPAWSRNAWISCSTAARCFG